MRFLSFFFPRARNFNRWNVSRIPGVSPRRRFPFSSFFPPSSVLLFFFFFFSFPPFHLLPFFSSPTAFFFPLSPLHWKKSQRIVFARSSLRAFELSSLRRAYPFLEFLLFQVLLSFRITFSSRCPQAIFSFRHSSFFSFASSFPPQLLFGWFPLFFRLSTGSSPF